MNFPLFILLIDFDWENLLFGEHDWAFLFMVFIRTFTMFLVILIGLRMLGKRSVNQLSIFELGVITGLGSAAGDPMFYKSVGLLFCIFVFIVVITLYHLLKYLVSHNQKLKIWLEGETVEVVKDGEICKARLQEELSNMQEVFLLLRVKSVSQLGQVRSAFLEPNGLLSVYYFADEDVKYGLPVIPGYYKHPHKVIPEDGHYSCTNCSHTTVLQAGLPADCTVCNKNKWVNGNKEIRIA